jgi:hypothetical protein
VEEQGREVLEEEFEDEILSELALTTELKESGRGDEGEEDLEEEEEDDDDDDEGLLEVVVAVVVEEELDEQEDKEEVDELLLIEERIGTSLESLYNNHNVNSHKEILPYPSKVGKERVTLSKRPERSLE